MRYLGAIYRFDAYNPEVPKQARTLATKKNGYLRNLVRRFEKEHGGIRLQKVKTQCPSPRKQGVEA